MRENKVRVIKSVIVGKLVGMVGQWRGQDLKEGGAERLRKFLQEATPLYYVTSCGSHVTILYISSLANFKLNLEINKVLRVC